MLLILICATCLSASILIPTDKVPAYKRVKAAAGRLANILRAKTTVSCRVEGGAMILTTTRHDLVDEIEFTTDQITSCEVDGDRFEIEFQAGGCGFDVTSMGAGFGVGLVAGLTTCFVK